MVHGHFEVLYQMIKGTAKRCLITYTGKYNTKHIATDAAKRHLVTKKRLYSIGNL